MSQYFPSSGDFASVAEVVLKGRCPEQGTLKMLDIEKSLDDIAAANAEKKRDVVKVCPDKSTDFL